MTLKIHGTSGRTRALHFSCAWLALSGLLLSGCLGSPTYGTGKAADEQLLEDVTGILSLGPSQEEQIDYKPRPELVTPASKEVLPLPQDNIVSASRQAWPESPEQRRARLRAEATENQDNPAYEPKIASDVKSRPGINSAARFNQPGNFEVPPSSSNEREEFKRRLAQSKQGSPTTRRYLSEPPLEYRAPAATAPNDDIGEDEWKKETRLKREARQKAGQSSWRDMVPWL
jgi:hypothetical protein